MELLHAPVDHPGNQEEHMSFLPNKIEFSRPKASPMKFFGTKEIKHHVRVILDGWQEELKGKAVLDIPCGNGFSLEILLKHQALAVGADLFPELNRASGARVVGADLNNPLPFPDESFDFVLCQEGIEHVGGQDRVLREFSRILKPGGRLLLTTPNYSNLKSKMSYLLTESEAYGRIMPPNERDSIWLSAPHKDQSEPEIYFGHVFLTGILRLRLFGITSGLYIKRLHASRVNYTSLFWFPLLYPLILFFSWKTQRRMIRKTGNRALAKELMRMMINPSVLLQNHLLLEFEKRKAPTQALRDLSTKNDFNMTT